MSMKGDFSRFTFDRRKHYSAVRMQQGRVQLDADWNEYIDIVNYLNETRQKDLLGVSAAPMGDAGFRIRVKQRAERESGVSGNEGPEISVGPGRYYVDGILCENEQERHISGQQLSQKFALVYLDVWKRDVTAFEDPSLRELALGGVDTTTREQIQWQVKLLPLAEQHFSTEHASQEVQALPEWKALRARQEHKGLMCARHNLSTALENRLYRVEIHSTHNGNITFKWSRENASLLFALDDISEVEKRNGMVSYTVTLAEPLRDRSQLSKGDWVEFVDISTLSLYQVVEISDLTITLKGQHSQRLEEAIAADKETALLLRRWDHDINRNSTAVIPVREDEWLDLERGIQVCFAANGGTYNAGDYWLIPARALSGAITWPANEFLPPHGVTHHYCPLALLHSPHNQWSLFRDLRQFFAPLPLITTSMEHHTAKHLLEEYIGEEELAIGDLVALVPTTKRNIVKAQPENARLLLGVVAERIEEREGHYLVAIYGRMRCKVVGPVDWGDLLTVSHRDGCARVVYREHIASHHGTILGKALDAYLPEDEDDIGMIDIMITLQ